LPIQIYKIVYNGWKKIWAIHESRSDGAKIGGTHKYQIGGDSTKIGRAGTKIGGPVMDFSVFIYFEEGEQSGNLSIFIANNQPQTGAANACF